MSLRLNYNMKKKYYQVVFRKNYLKFICEYGIIRTPIIFEYSIIDEIIKIIKNLFEMFYLCCYEIRTNVELDIKIVAFLNKTIISFSCYYKMVK